jgi:hypothetical protein
VDLVVYDDDEKRYVPWAVALAGLLLVALVTAGLTFALARQASGDQGEQALGGITTPAPATSPSAAAPATAAPPTTEPSAAAPSAAPATSAPAAAPTTAPAAAPAAAPACAAALRRADEALERAVALDEALSQHTEIMDELLAERIDAEEALDRTLPVLTDGATERRRFEQDVSSYSESRGDCPA